MFALQFVKWGCEQWLIPIVIVIVIKCHLVPLFFSQKWHPNFGLFWGYNIITVGTHDASTLPSLCLRFAFALPSLLRWRQGVSKMGRNSPHPYLSISGWDIIIGGGSTCGQTAAQLLFEKSYYFTGWSAWNFSKRSFNAGNWSRSTSATQARMPCLWLPVMSRAIALMP